MVRAQKNALLDLISDEALKNYTLSKSHQIVKGVKRKLATSSRFLVDLIGEWIYFVSANPI